MPRLRLPLFIAEPPFLYNGSPVVFLLIFGAIGAAAMGAWMYFGGPRAKPNRELTVAYANPRSYPSTPFTTQPSIRQVVFSSANGPVGTAVFQAFDIAAKPAPQQPGAKPEPTTTGNVAITQQLSTKGYSWTTESFITAARQGDVNILLAFIKNGFDIRQANAFGNTALYAAAEANQPTAVKLLLAAGSDINLTNGRGFTPLHRAVEANLTGMTQLLLAAGAKPDEPANDGRTPLFYAVENNNLDIVHALLTAGAKVTALDRYKHTLLHIAVTKGLVDLTKQLIAAGANVNAADANQIAPLHIAIDSGNYQLAKLLLENGASATQPGGGGVTPMSMALGKQNVAIANLLLAHGAPRPNALGK